MSRWQDGERVRTRVELRSTGLVIGAGEEGTVVHTRFVGLNQTEITSVQFDGYLGLGNWAVPPHHLERAEPTTEERTALALEQAAKAMTELGQQTSALMAVLAEAAQVLGPVMAQLLERLGPPSPVCGDYDHASRRCCRLSTGHAGDHSDTGVMWS